MLNPRPLIALAYGFVMGRGCKLTRALHHAPARLHPKSMVAYLPPSRLAGHAPINRFKPNKMSMSLRKFIYLLAAPLCCAPIFGANALHFADGNGGINLPPGFRAVVVADKVGRTRQIAVRENGDAYVCLLDPVDRNYVAAMRDTDGDGRMDIIKYFGELDDRCKGLRLYKGYLYVSSSSQVVRWKLDDEELLPEGEHEVIVTGFPDQRSHRDKVFTFDDQGHIYVENGAPSNACQQQQRTKGSPGMDPCPQLERAAGIWRFDAEKPGQLQMEDGYHYATGIRNSIAMTWDPVKRQLYVVQHGRDQLHQLWPESYTQREGAELPAEEFLKVDDGDDFGWPYTYYDHFEGARMIAPEYGGNGEMRAEPGKYEDPIMAFPGHWGPNDLRFYNAEQFPERYRGGAFIAFHGSWNRAPLPQEGYNVVFVPFEGQYPKGGYEIFADGFTGKEVLRNPGAARYRPTAVYVGPDGSLYITEDAQGRIWRVVYVGDEPERAAGDATADSQGGLAASQPASLQENPTGRQLYQTYCLTCHQADGSGVPDMQAPLVGSTRWDDTEYQIRLLLQGSQWVKNSDYENIMPSFSYLSNEDLAAVINYAKAKFGRLPGDVAPEKVAALRKRFGL